MNTHRLWQAAQIIEAMHKKPLEMIEFEDGSGQKFNYRLSGETDKRFINLKNVKYGKD